MPKPVDTPPRTEAEKSLEWGIAALTAHIGSGFYGKLIFEVQDGAVKRIVKEESMRAPYIEQTYRGVVDPR